MINMYQNVYMHWTELTGYGKPQYENTEVKKSERKVEPVEKTNDNKSFDEYG